MLKKALLSASMLPLMVATALEITADFVIVNGKLSGHPSESASVVLAEHLEKILGKRPEVMKEEDYDGKKPAIKLAEDEKLDMEEWSIKTAGSDLLISGGHPRGLYYGVGEFLEKFANVRWFTVVNHRIPKADKIVVPDGREFRRKPDFPLSRSTSKYLGKRSGFAFSINKQNSASYQALWPSTYTNAGINNGHSYYRLTKDLPEDSPMLPVQADGRKVRATSGMGPGQICYANKDFREHTKKEVAKWIQQEKEFIKKHNLEESSRFRWIDITQNDNTNHCSCSGCKELIEKYGTISGAQLEYINDIASAYPEYIFQTFAYARTTEPPKNIKARDNVMIWFAFLGDNIIWYDVLRPLSAPTNKVLMDYFEGWDKVAKHKAIWCYHRLYSMTEAFPWPQCSYWYIAEDFRFYKKIGVQKLYDESEFFYHGSNPRAFHDLHIFLSVKLMDDTTLDENKLIDEFFDYQYGPASKIMREYSDYLKKRLDAIPGIMCMQPIHTRNVLDVEFFTKVNGWLDQAEALLKGDEERIENVKMERLPVILAQIHMWERLKLGSREEYLRLVDEYEKIAFIPFNRYVVGEAKRIGNTPLDKALADEKSRIELLRAPAIPVPKEFADKDVIQFTMVQTNSEDLVKDPESICGSAACLKEVKDKRFDHDKQPMEFGLYNYNRKVREVKKVISPEEVYQDEGYHLYYIGTIKPNGFEKQYLWAHRSWLLHMRVSIKDIWESTNPDQEYDLYISCKLTGPAYVKGSQKENAAYVDRVILVKK